MEEGEGCVEDWAEGAALGFEWWGAGRGGFFCCCGCGWSSRHGLRGELWVLGLSIDCRRRDGGGLRPGLRDGRVLEGFESAALTKGANTLHTSTCRPRCPLKSSSVKGQVDTTTRTEFPGRLAKLCLHCR